MSVLGRYSRLENLPVHLGGHAHFRRSKKMHIFKTALTAKHAHAWWYNISPLKIVLSIMWDLILAVISYLVIVSAWHLVL